HRGEIFYKSLGKVEEWMGICDGWAAASYMLDRPTNAVKTVAVDGTSLTFYPSDIKALASQLWAHPAPSRGYRSAGGRCYKKNPATDEYGRIVDQDCFDTNPGTLHLAVVNQIGVKERSFVFDATYDYEVWNQPMYAYFARYFNPQKGTWQERLED